MDAAGRVVGVLHRDDMYYSSLLMVSALDLCNRTGSRNAARRSLAGRLADQGLCPEPAQTAGPPAGQAASGALGERVSGALRRLDAVRALPAAAFDGGRAGFRP